MKRLDTAPRRRLKNKPLLHTAFPLLCIPDTQKEIKSRMVFPVAAFMVKSTDFPLLWLRVFGAGRNQAQLLPDPR